MNKTIFILSIVVSILGTIFLMQFVNSCSKPELTTMKRDSVDQKVIDSVLKIVIPILDRQGEIIDSALANTNRGVTENKTRYQVISKEHQQSPVNQSYERIKERLKR